MPFDPTSARPVAPKRFDPASARPEGKKPGGFDSTSTPPAAPGLIERGVAAIGNLRRRMQAEANEASSGVPEGPDSPDEQNRAILAYQKREREAELRRELAPRQSEVPADGYFPDNQSRTPGAVDRPVAERRIRERNLAAGRTTGEVISDAAGAVGAGMQQIPASFVGLFAPDSETAERMQRAAQAADGNLSPFLQARLEEARERIQAAAQDGLWDEVKAASDEYLTDPTLFSYFALRTMPSMLGVLGPAKLAQAAAAMRGASAAQIAKVTAATAGAANAGMTGGDARQQAYDTIYQALREQGVPDEEARARALEESLLSAGVGAGLGWFGGKYGAEAGMLGLGTGRTAAGRAAGAIAGETTTELAEELAPQLLTNSLASRIDGRNPLEGLGETAAQTVAGIGPMATVGAVGAARRPATEADAAARDLQNLVEGSQFVQPADQAARQLLDPENAQLTEVPDAAASLDATGDQGQGADPRGGAGLARDGGEGAAGGSGAAGETASGGGAGVALGDPAGQSTAGVVDPLDQLLLEREAAAIETGDPIEVLVTQAEGAALRAAAGPREAAGAALLGFPQSPQVESAKEVPALLRSEIRTDGTLYVAAPVEAVRNLTQALGVTGLAGKLLRTRNNETVVSAKTAGQVNAALRYALEPFQYSAQDRADADILARAQGAKPGAVRLVTPDALPATVQNSSDVRLSATEAVYLGRVLGANGRSLVLYRADPKEVGLGGAIIRGRNGKVFLNVAGAINPIAEVVHEVGHSIRRENEGAYQAYLSALASTQALDMSDGALISWAQANFGGGVTSLDEAMKRVQVTSRDELLEEFVMDATGQASLQGGFWDAVFDELSKTNPSALQAFVQGMKAMTARLRQELFNRGANFAGIEKHIRDLEKLTELAGRYYAQGAKAAGQKVSGAHAETGTVVASKQRIGPFAKAESARATQEWHARQGVQYEIEQTPEGVFLARVGDTNGQASSAQGAGAGLARREGVRGVQPQDPGQYQRADGRPERSTAVAGSSGERGGYNRGDSRPTYGRPGKPGSVTVVGTHFSRQQRAALTGALFGTGHVAEEARRLEGADPAIRSRIYFYIDEGNGINAEAGTGGHAHEVELSNLYDWDTDSEGVVSRNYRVGDSQSSNAVEKALVDAGYDGYYKAAAFGAAGKTQGVAVLLGKRHLGVPVAYLGQGDGKIPARSGAKPVKTDTVSPITQAKELAARARALKGMPAGELPASRWRDMLAGADEEVFQAFDKAGLLDGEERVYLSELAGRYVRQAANEGAVVRSSTRTLEKLSDHQLELEREDRELAEKTRLSAAEKKQISADAKKFGFTTKELEREVRRIKARFPVEAGWAPIVFNKLDGKTLKKKATEETPLPVDAIFFKKIAYGFHLDKSGKADKKTQAARTKQMAQALAGEILAKYVAAQSGDPVGVTIMRQSGWYRELRAKLRAVFGGFADYFAQLLGPTSANNPVEPNFRYATEALRLATSGQWDNIIRESLAWQADIQMAAANLDAVESSLTAEQRKAIKALENETQERFGKGNKSEERTQFVEDGLRAISQELSDARTALREAAVFKGTEPKRDNGKRFGMATNGILEILADSWGDKQPGDAPKTKNYYQNIIGRTVEATIDVWAARTLRRLANDLIGNFPRIPNPAEQGVQGNILASGEAAGSEFGFGQDVFREAAAELRASGIPTFKDVTPSEVQAMIWFAEKELWTRRDWTTKIGEGGSIEQELLLAGYPNREELQAWRVAARAGQPKMKDLSGLDDKARARAEASWRRKVAKWEQARDAAKEALDNIARYPDRFIAGVASEIPGDRPLDSEMASLAREVEGAIQSVPGVMAMRAQSSTGVFMNDRERTLDVEFTTRNGYDPAPVAQKLRELGDREGQQATFLSRVLRPDEVGGVDMLRHRPGLELYFSERISPSAAERLIKVVQDAGFAGMTLATEGRRTPDALAGASQDVVGIRVQFIPEFNVGDWEGAYRADMTEAEIKDLVKNAASQMADLVNDLGQMAEVSTAEVHWYETEVNFYGDTGGVAEGAPDGAGSEAWSGRTIREGLANADRFNREQRSDALADGRARIREEREVRRSGGSQGEVIPTVLRSPRRLLTAAWSKLAESPDVFQYPKSDADTMQGVFKDLDVGFTVSERFILSDKETRRGVVKKWVIKTADGQEAEVFRNKKDEIWVNASALKVGVSRGAALYAGLLNYAYNSMGKLIGDPLGVSDMAIFRRTENMLSSALKFGTTEHMAPAKEQQNPALFAGTMGHTSGVTEQFKPLAWSDDHQENLANLLEVSYAHVTRFVPEVKDAYYNFDAGEFRWAATDRRLEDGDFERLARALRRGLGDPTVSLGGTEPAGSDSVPALRPGAVRGGATLQRAILTHTLLRAASSEDGGRSSLAAIGGELRGGLDGAGQTAAGSGAELPGILYSRRRNELGFFSPLARAVEGAKFQAQPAQQWKLWLASNAAKAGVKADEVQWSGLNEWLDLQGKRKVEKTEVLAYLEQGGVQVEEVQLSDARVDPEALRDFLVINDLATPDELEDARIEDWLPLAEDHGFDTAAGGTQYAGWRTPSGENYREVLLTLPGENPARARFEEQISKIQEQAKAEMRELSPGEEALLRAYQEQLAELPASKVKGATYRSRHWKQPNVLAHLRLDDRTDVDGNRVLFVQEIQSDWGQEGRDKGFRDPAKGYVTDEALSALHKALREAAVPVMVEKLKVSDTTARELARKTELSTIADFLGRREELDAAVASNLEGRTKPAAAPFVTDTKAWVALAIKRVILMAAEGGYDRVAFVSGDQAAELFRLDRQVAEVAYNKTTQFLRVLDTEGNTVINDATPAEQLPQVVGKELADRIAQDEARFVQLKGDGLKIEARGMRDFYDRIVPQVANDVLKKLGGGKIDTLNVSGQNQLGFDITPVMREKVQTEGLPLFSRTRNQTAAFPAPALPDSRSKRALDKVIYNLQDRLVDLKEIQKSIEAAGRTIRDEFNPYMAETLMHGKAAYRVQHFLDQEIEPVLALMRGAGISVEELNRYLHARHAEERNAAMAKRNPNQDELDQLIQDAGEELLDAELAASADPTDGAAQRRVIRAQTRLDALRAAKPWSGTEEERQRLSGMSNDEAKAILDAAHGGPKAAAYRKLGQKIDAITGQTRSEMAAYGLESLEMVGAMDQAYDHYVPLHRDMDESDLLDTMGGTGRGFSIRGSQVKRATGSLRAVENILANVVAQREATIVRGEKNRVAKALYGLVMEHPNPDLFTVIRPGMPEKQLRAELQSMGLDPATVDTMVKAPMVSAINERTGLAERRVNPMYSRLDNAVVLRINGEDRVILFNKESDRAVRLVRALRNDDAESGGSRFIMDHIGPITRYLAAINTQYNPIFGLTNFARDLQGAALNLETTPVADRKAQLVGNIPAAIRGIWNWERGDRQHSWAKLYEEFLADGGATGYRDAYGSLADRAAAIERDLGKTGLRNAAGIRQVLTLLSDYNTAVENATRLAAYKAARDAGISRAKAADLAKDITVNFNRKGARSGFWASLYAFFNSAVQGTERTVRVLRGPTGKKILGAGVALGAMNAALGMLLLGDDWDEIPEFERAKHLILPLPWTEQKYVKIPYPLGYNAIPNAGRSVVEMAVYRDRLGERGLALLGETLDAFNPISASTMVGMVMPSVLDPAVELASNQNAFGRPISKEDLSPLDPTPGFTRAREGTAGPFKALAQAINAATGGDDYAPGLWSPTAEQLSYVFGVATGGLGREIEKFVATGEATVKGDPLPPYKIPVVGRFYGEAGGDNVIRKQYFDAIREVNIAENQLKGRARDGKDIDGFELGALAQASRRFQSGISALQKEAQRTRDREERKRINQEIVELQRQFVELVAQSRP